ncbi:MAG: uracil-DNA glycosylase [Gammaproteobacteria bacterium SG8_47]|nr:MAG: uracil-DNA glycosylase [Gammaproteobacteria bacterium SG8_47]
MADIAAALRRHQARLRACRRCALMNGPPVVGNPVVSPVMLVGQAPGPKEITINRPFAWTAGKTLFKWFASIGLDEDAFRRRVYMAAVCRCFPGKQPRGGDRVPNREEVANCADWLQRELVLLRPQLIVPVGKLAIAQFMDVTTLDAVVGHVWAWSEGDLQADLAPLPHPSGASTWHRTDPGRGLLAVALENIAEHPAWRALCAAER